MPLRPRPALDDVQPAIHGGLDYAELAALGLSPDDVVDFSANLNPFGPPPAVRQAVAGVPISRYPDSEAGALCRAIAASLGVGSDRVIAGNGSSELLWLIALAFLDPGERVLIAGPTFGEYERAARLAGAEVAFCQADPAHGFRHDVRDLAIVVQQWRPRLTFLCNPNNPTGAYLDHQSIARLVEQTGDGLLVLDEAYVGFVAEPWSSLDLLPRGVLVLRSLTKDYALAGLRLGYAVGEPDTIAALNKTRPPWNVNAIAQAAGMACLGDPDHVATSRGRLLEAKQYLVAALTDLGLRVLPSVTTFFLVEVGDARAFRAGLLRQRLLVRDCASFGLPQYVRIAARTLPECEQLVTAIRALSDQRSDAL